MTENPYIAMTDDVFKTHLEQLKEVIATRKVDITQLFSTVSVMTDEQKKMVEEYPKLQEQIKNLSAAHAGKDLTEIEKKLAQTSIDAQIKELKSVDVNVPLDGIIKSGFNNVEKLEILSGVAPIVQHFGTVISNLRSQIGNKEGQPQNFAAPDLSGGKKAEDIIAEVIKSIV